MSVPRKFEFQHTTSRIVIRPPTLEDASEIYQAIRISREELAPWMDWCTPHYSIDMTIARLRRLPKDWEEGIEYAFVIFDKSSGECFGACGINHINERHQFANLGYWIRSDRTGVGIATEAAKILAQFGLKQLGLKRIEIVVGVENWASRRVAEKAGAHFEGIQRKRIKIGDRNIDAAMYSLTQENFQ